MFDAENNPSAKPSDLDLIKIEDLEVDDAILAESGLWSVLRYPKYYSIVFHTQKHKFGIIDVGSKEEVIGILNKV